MNGQWIKCSERQPDEAGWYLTVMPTRWGDNVVTTAYCRHNQTWSIEQPSEMAGPPTHWQPLPELPEGVNP